MKAMIDAFGSVIDAFGSLLKKLRLSAPPAPVPVPVVDRSNRRVYPRQGR
jgi:hypothetical protein